MYRSQFISAGRESHNVEHHVDVAITGGGLAGVCAALSAARNGLKVCLIQDRPVLGGNASSEVRLWSLGATSHMGNNNRYSREGGIIDEIMLENLYRNPEGNTLILDTVLLEKVTVEENITLLLNTAVYDVDKVDDETISSVTAYCSQNATEYVVKADYFCDGSGDGVVAFMAGAPFRIGAEGHDEFSEKMAPIQEESELLGHSIYFYSKDVGQPTTFIPPSFASIDKMTLDRVKRIKSSDIGPRLWWLEFGGNLDTIYQSEDIKFELWKVVYGVWDYIKNSGKFEGVENLTLEWVGTIPGKRESRRFEGETMLVQQDLVEQRSHDDAISYGGWAIDHHPGDGVYSDRPPCQQYHTKGVYTIPLRSFVPQKMKNLFVLGRLISASHIAFGSTRVMCTCAHGGQAIGRAIALCKENNIGIRELFERDNINALQQSLLIDGHFIPSLKILPAHNKLSGSTITASSTLMLSSLPANDSWKRLTVSGAQMLPLCANTKYQFTTKVRATKPTVLTIQLRTSDRLANYTPNVIVHEHQYTLTQGIQVIEFSCPVSLSEDQYAFLCFMQNSDVDVVLSDKRVTGVMSVFNGENKAVSNTGFQGVEGDIGIDEFEFWIPERRPAGHNFAMDIKPALNCYSPQNTVNGITRPYLAPNAWVAQWGASEAELHFKLPEAQFINKLTLHFDADFDHALESSLMGHHENTMPFCVADYRILDGNNNEIVCRQSNYQSVNKIVFDKPLKTDTLIIVFKQKVGHVPISIFEIIAQ